MINKITHLLGEIPLPKFVLRWIAARLIRREVKKLKFFTLQERFKVEMKAYLQSFVTKNPDVAATARIRKLLEEIYESALNPKMKFDAARLTQATELVLAGMEQIHQQMKAGK